MPQNRTPLYLAGLAGTLVLGIVVAATFMGSSSGSGGSEFGNSPFWFFSGIMLLGLGLPLLLGRLTYAALRHWQPHYAARPLAALGLACLASWIGPKFVMHVFASTVWFVFIQLALPAAGAWLGWRLTRRPI